MTNRMIDYKTTICNYVNYVFYVVKKNTFAP